ncbi:MAG: tetratricopeptide repeat-containing sulfotransferase family protein [Isosphaeraceae bacterium]
MQDHLRAAIALHQAGQLGRAAERYQQVLAQDPSNADALHLLGVLHHQEGNYPRAVSLIGRAVALRPNVAVYHANLAEPFRELGEFERAAGCCRAALSLQPDYPEAIGNLGLALQGLGRLAEAVEQFRRALALRPDFATVHSNLGNALRELGQLDLALDHFRRAVEIAPHDAHARTNLGQMLLERGKADEALPHCEAAVRLEPDIAALHHNLGNAYRELGRFVEAKAAYLEAIRLAPDLAKAHAHLGLTLLKEYEYADALPWLKRATELAPEDPTLHEMLGDFYLEREEFALAAACYERVLALAKVDRAELRLSLGWALQEQGRLAEADEQYQIALRLAPKSAMVQNYVGGLHEELGKLSAAESAYRLAIQLEPQFALPYARLGSLLRGKLPDRDVAAIEKWLADPAQGPEPRGRLLFALAHVLDGRGEYDRAAGCLREANELTVESRKGRRKNLPAEHERFVTGLIDAFTPAFFARTAGQGLNTRLPVFIFGLPRSGTTLIEQILACHSCVFGAGELRLGRESFDSICAQMGRTDRPLECVPDLDGPMIGRIAETHRAALRALAGPEAQRASDKMPDNYLYLGLLATLFPQATFIHCRRDLRDVALSCWMTDFRSLYWASDPNHIGALFRQYLRIMDHWRSVLPVKIHDVDYEETVDDLETVARRLVAACGLPWEPRCLQPHRNERPVRTASLTQVREPVHKKSVARWTKYETALADLFAALPRNVEKPG